MPITKDQILITIDGVKDLIASGTNFRCRYELVGFTEGQPEAVLVSTRFGPYGPEARLFNIWPGLFKHHHEFGDGRALTIGSDYHIAFDTPGGGDGVHRSGRRQNN